MVKQRKRLQLLEELKEYRGPIKNDKEVEKYLDDHLLTDKDKQRRRKFSLLVTAAQPCLK